MRPASWLALALLPVLASCGVRYHGSYGGSSFTSGILAEIEGKRVSLGSLKGDCSRYGMMASCDTLAMEFHSDFDPADFDLVARVFQDLNGDGAYSEGVDRVLAKSTPARVSGTTLSLDRIAFDFRPHHEPIAMTFELHRGEQLVHSRPETF